MRPVISSQLQQLSHSSLFTTDGLLYLLIHSRSDKVTITDTYHYDDVDDKFEREPFIVRVSSASTDFAMVAIHVKPSDAVQEIDTLLDVYDDTVTRWNLEDVIILGDFNAGCDYVTSWDNIRLRTDNRFTWLISDRADTTVSRLNCPYDRIVVAGATMLQSVWPGSSDVFYFDQAYGLSYDQTNDVSDHYPVELKILPKLSEIERSISIQSSFGVSDSSHSVNTSDVLDFTSKSSVYGFEHVRFTQGDATVVVVWKRSEVGRQGIITIVNELHQNFDSLVSELQKNVVLENIENSFNDVISDSVSGLTSDVWYAQIVCTLDDVNRCIVYVINSPFYGASGWSVAANNGIGTLVTNTILLVASFVYIIFADY
uniref:Uncharacterized protein LOC100368587 n=1 Tax=Saccoglossus kowalevskii TaxID=10224 RepID=A0ABM0MHC9_SACKO|nr:PREDICTED: uncharacterized protein LOC100368587 [Saccoglossus kowalevskii]